MVSTEKIFVLVHLWIGPFRKERIYSRVLMDDCVMNDEARLEWM